MRRTYRWDRETRKMVEITPSDRIIRHEVMPDVQPYRSMITGETIGGRAQHREHLRKHGCIEVGNEKPEPKPFLPDREQIKNDVREANRALLWHEQPTLRQLREMRPQALKDMGLD